MVLDLELVNGARFRPEEPSQREQAAIAKLHPVDYSIYTKKLQLICRESRELIKRLGISPFITAGDTAQGIYTANGDMAIAEVGTYMHVVTGILPIKYVIKHYASDPTMGLKDGDLFFCNEAVYGGIHNPDMINFLPVYAEGEIIAWVNSASHEPETGATEAGGMPISAKSRYDEGLKVPPVKVGESFTLRRDWVDLIENNVRYPLMITNDHAARIAACLRLRKRILEIVDRKGKEFVIGMLRKLILDTTEIVRERVRKIPDGIFRHVAFIDTIGHQEGLVRLPVMLVKSGDRITLDFTHASPAVPGPYNTFEHVVQAHIACSVFQYMLNDVPASAGCLVPFDIKTSKGSCLNANIDSSISNVSFILPTVINAVQILFIKALFSASEFRKDEYIALPTSNLLGDFHISGFNQWNRYIVAALLAHDNSMAGGARPDKDGVDSIGFWFSGHAEAADCEQDESSYPLTILWRSYMLDGGGPGKFRGGTGVSFGYMVRNTNELGVMPVGTGHRFHTCHGVFGGYPAPTRSTVIMNHALASLATEKSTPHNEFELVEKCPAKDRLIILPTSHPTLKLNEGDIFAKPSGGGGGYGDVLERQPEAVLKDIALGKISHWAAWNIYRVVCDTPTLTLNKEATEKERSRERMARTERGKPHAQFLREWTKKSPTLEILRFYGEWPIPE